ncbi:MAG: type II secretion system protein GspC [Gammaproteobacteria bacterium]|nr:type II secretion system protein GspC [Gammaproteobacteria bacterium]MDX5375293.1 type II secretion system protein GspC [Gammaproteobacteria bacterium]
MTSTHLGNWLRHEPWLFRLVLLAVLALLARTLSGLTWQFITPHPPIEVVMPAPTPATTPRIQAQNPAIPLALKHLFGTAEVLGDTPADAPETRLDLKLVGVYATGDASALAIIVPGQRQATLYGIGDNLPGNATLRSVYPDRVILERNGQLETLKLPLETLDNALGTGRPDAAEMTQDNVAAQLARYRNDALRNPARLAEAIAAEPVMDNGRLIGYRLTPRQPLPLFEQAGLRPGDVVTEVNGIALNRPEAGIIVLRQLATASTLNVTVLRDGSAQTIQATIGK